MISIQNTMRVQTWVTHWAHTYSVEKHQIDVDTMDGTVCRRTNMAGYMFNNWNIQTLLTTWSKCLHTHRQSAREKTNHTKPGPTKREKTSEIFASMAKYMVIRPSANKMSTRTGLCILHGGILLSLECTILIEIFMSKIRFRVRIWTLFKHTQDAFSQL